MNIHEISILFFVATFAMVIYIVILRVKVIKLKNKLLTYETIEGKEKTLETVLKILNFYYYAHFESHYKNDFVLKQKLKNYRFESDELIDIIKGVSINIYNSLSNSEKQSIMKLLKYNDDQLIGFLISNVKNNVYEFILESKS